MKLFLLALLLVCYEQPCLAQPKQYSSFQDYYLTNTNLDSLQHELYSHRDNSVNYLNGLIWLEFSRYYISGRFGDDLPTIKTLAYQLNIPLAIASYHYLEALYSRELNLASAVRNGLEAVRYFESGKDTTGMLGCYSVMVLLGVNAGKFHINNMRSPDYYYEKIMALGNKSLNPLDKLIRIRVILAFEKMVKGEQNFQERVGEIDNALILLNHYPLLESVRPAIYSNASAFYERHKQPQQSLDYTLKAHELLKKRTTEICGISLYNIADCYYDVGDYKQAEFFFQEVIKAIEPKKAQLSLLISSYCELGEIQFLNKQYDAAWASKSKAEAMFNERNRRLRGSLLEELATQHDTDLKSIENRLLVEKNKLATIQNQKLQQEAKIQALREKSKLDKIQTVNYKKEAENRLLLQNNQSIIDLNKQYKLLLAVSLFAFIIVIILIYVLYRSNSRQKKLIYFRDKLYTIIAHDLRGPIGSLMSVGTLLRYLIKENRTDEIEKLIQQIDSMGQQTSLLLNNLLEWGKSYYFKEQSGRQQFDAAPLLKELMTVYEVLAENKGIKFSVAVPTHYPLTANPKDLSLILRNLIDNALKHTPKGGSVDVIATQQLPILQKPTAAMIQVHDSGIGIAPDQLAYVQKIFAGKMKPQVGAHGLGLGLVLINDFARKNGATLQFSSQQGLGTTISLLMS